MSYLFRACRSAVLLLIVSISTLTPTGMLATQPGSIAITMNYPGGPSNYAAKVSGPITVEQAMQQANIQYNATYFAGYGYALMLFNRTPASTNGQFGSSYWWLCVNGKTPKQGMSSQQVSPGDSVQWYWVTKGSDPCQNDSSDDKARYKNAKKPQGAPEK
jgi:Domain of unknown function (DUF4430)